MSMEDKSVGITTQDKGSKYCVECGAKMPGAVRTCPACGETR